MDPLYTSKRFPHKLLPTLAAALLVVFTGAVCSAQQIRWETDIEKASRTALETERLVWLHFEADWCVPCQRLETFVFSSTGVIRAIDQNVVAVKVDVDQAENLVKKMGVQRVPHDIIMTPAGRVIMSRSSPKTTAGYRKLISDLDRPLQQLNSGDRESLNFGIDQLHQIARSGASSEKLKESGFAVDGPTHAMAPQTIEGQRLARGFESAKRASAIRAERGAELKQKAKLFIASEERKLRQPKFAQNPFFKDKPTAASQDLKKPLMLKRDFDSATKNTKSFSALGGIAIAAPQQAMKANNFIPDSTGKKIATSSGLDNGDQDFLPPTPVKFGGKPTLAKAAQPALDTKPLATREEYLFSTDRLKTSAVVPNAQDRKTTLAGKVASAELADHLALPGLSQSSDLGPLDPPPKQVVTSTKRPSAAPPLANQFSNRPAHNRFEAQQQGSRNEFDLGGLKSDREALGFLANQQTKQKATVVAIPKAPPVVAGEVKVGQPSLNKKTSGVTVQGHLVPAAKPKAKFVATPKTRIDSMTPSPQRDGVALKNNSKSKTNDLSESRKYSRALQILANESRSKGNQSALQNLANPSAQQGEHSNPNSHLDRSAVAEKTTMVAPLPAEDRTNFALKGKCPVTLLTESRWIDGRSRVGCVHRNRVYLFASERHREVFQQNPDAFSPLLAGFDPVTYEKTKKLVDGEEKHGVFMGKVPNLRVVLFENAENRELFQSQPGQYLNLIRRAMTDAAPKATKLR